MSSLTGSDGEQGTVTVRIRETVDDDSPRGEAYSDDRTTLAYVYRGAELLQTVHATSALKALIDDPPRAATEISTTPAGTLRLSDAYLEADLVVASSVPDAVTEAPPEASTVEVQVSSSASLDTEPGPGQEQIASYLSDE
ncbi:hypothetical protein RYH80_17975 [Halobaculum sp. MBLA0147]|uniref:hypothetical protein n=1 Tax=Halobaculum sp. MBLA0147 TaxID=3079934 RepID=UPI003525B8A7